MGVELVDNENPNPLRVGGKRLLDMGRKIGLLTSIAHGRCGTFVFDTLNRRHFE